MQFLVNISYTLDTECKHEIKQIPTINGLNKANNGALEIGLNLTFF